MEIEKSHDAIVEIGGSSPVDCGCSMQPSFEERRKVKNWVELYIVGSRIERVLHC